MPGLSWRLTRSQARCNSASCSDAHSTTRLRARAGKDPFSIARSCSRTRNLLRPILRVKVGWAMLPKVHSDCDAMEPAELRHPLRQAGHPFPRRRWTWSGRRRAHPDRSRCQGSTRWIHAAQRIPCRRRRARSRRERRLGRPDRKIDLPGHAVRVPEPDPVPVAWLHLDRSNHHPAPRQHHAPAKPTAGQCGRPDGPTPQESALRSELRHGFPTETRPSPARRPVPRRGCPPCRSCPRGTRTRRDRPRWRSS